ncbi:MAG: FAD-dependent thymidylate synthase [Clostridia bacterium]|nr:FAD-dependent thymidylate synthase [Clostridia bacterium]
MKVQLINYTRDPEKTVAAAARLCYSDKYGSELMQDLAQSEIESLIRRLYAMGHLSPFEHANFTFSIEGVSRALSHQLVRHRIASYSQKSQRYVSEDAFEYVMPPSVFEKDEARATFESAMGKIQAAYKELSAAIPREDARYVLPNACETNVICTFNARSLLNFFKQRCCNRAQWEIRKMATAMLGEVRKAAPIIFEKAGAACDAEGYCPEGKMSCGKLKSESE